MATDDQVIGCGEQTADKYLCGQAHERREHHLVSIRIHRGVLVGIEYGIGAEILMAFFVNITIFACVNTGCGNAGACLCRFAG